MKRDHLRPLRHLARALVPLVSACLLGCSGDADRSSFEQVGATRQPILGGAADTTDPAAVMILKRASSTDVRIVCTGTVVAPHVVLTAAHCLDPRVAGAGGQYGIFVGDDNQDPAQAGDARRFFTAREVHFDPDFDPTNVTAKAGHDIGVVITAKPMPVAPLPMNREALSDVGLPIRVVGSGVTDTTTHADGRMFAYSTTVSGIDAQHLTFRDPARSICQGDSGGPSIATKGGRDVVVGVHSFGEHSVSCTGTNYDQRVDVEAAELVDPFIAQFDPDFPLDRGAPNAGAAPGDADAGSSAEATSSSGCSVGRGGRPRFSFFLAFAFACVLLRRRAGVERDLRRGARGRAATLPPEAR